MLIRDFGSNSAVLVPLDLNSDHDGSDHFGQYKPATQASILGLIPFLWHISTLFIKKLTFFFLFYHWDKTSFACKDVTFYTKYTRGKNKDIYKDIYILKGLFLFRFKRFKQLI